MTDSSNTTFMSQVSGEFPHTQWTMLTSVAEREQIKEHLYKLYWRPLYCLLVRKGFTIDDAREYTQGFLIEILLGKEFIRKADKGRGKFRSFLVKSFLNYVNQIRRKLRREQAFENIEDSEIDIPESVPSGPEAAFDYAWAAGILQRVFIDVERGCREDGLQTHWNIFKDRVMDPILDNTPPPGLPVLCKRYNAESPSQATNMIVTVKRRFQSALAQHIRNYAESEQAYQDELNEFIAIFAKEKNIC